jgi:hypothetical protein
MFYLEPYKVQNYCNNIMPKSRKRIKKKIEKKNRSGRQKTTSSWTARLRKKLASSNLLEGAEIKKGAFGIKVSELILDFGSDLIEGCKTEEDYRRIVPLLIICWNIGNLPEEEREENIETMLKELNFNEIEDIIRMLIDRKVDFYDEHKYLIAEYIITMLSDGDMHLAVASVEIN